jgi:hypothetical protein
LYAITDAPEARVDGTGVEDRPLMDITAGGLRAVVSEHDRTPALDEPAAWRFEQVIEAQMDAGSALPVRFGSLISDSAEVQRLLESRQDDLRAGLRRVDGAVELSVSGAWTEAAPTPPEATKGQSGADYLRRRAEDQRRARELAGELRKALRGLVSAERFRLLPRATLAFSAALLVPRQHVEQVVQAVTELGLTGLELVCTGPWPPYSFVDQGEDDD